MNPFKNYIKCRNEERAAVDAAEAVELQRREKDLTGHVKRVTAALSRVDFRIPDCFTWPADNTYAQGIAVQGEGKAIFKLTVYSAGGYDLRPL